MKKKATLLFHKANEELNKANEELQRSKEDVVTYAVCKNAQYAIENYLRGFLYANGIDPKKFETIENLYERCKQINPKFEQIDLSEFNCKSHKLDTRYCNEVSKVSSCFDAADQLDTLLRREKII